jgi:hypothetical protein
MARTRSKPGFTIEDVQTIQMWAEELIRFLLDGDPISDDRDKRVALANLFRIADAATAQLEAASVVRTENGSNGAVKRTRTNKKRGGLPVATLIDAEA